MSKPDVRSNLILTGAKMMEVKGYHAVGIQEIIENTGIPRGSFYYYFNSKEDFGLAVIHSFSAKYTEKVKAMLTDSTFTPKERLWNYLNTRREGLLCDMHCPDISLRGCLLAKLITEMKELPPSMQDFLKQEIESWIKLFAACIHAGQALDEIDPQSNAAHLAEFVFNAWVGALIMMQSSNNIKPVEVYLEYVFKKLLT